MSQVPSSMRRTFLPLAAGLVAVVLAGCTASEPGSSGGGTGIAVTQVRLQRSFTRILPADPQAGRPARIEAYVQLQDQFGDPLKGLGTFRFELYRYQMAGPLHLGKRFEQQGVQPVDLGGIQENQRHWDRITRSYRVPLDLPSEAAKHKKIVLQVTFFFANSEIRLRDILELQADS